MPTIRAKDGDPPDRQGYLRATTDHPELAPLTSLRRVTYPRAMQARNGAGYSGTPLAKKLGIKEQSRVLLVGAPESFVDLLAPLPSGVVFAGKAGPDVDLAHVFVTQKEDLARHLAVLRKKLKADAVTWISWPKKASKVPTTITEDTIRDVALPMGLVDVKVCAIDEVWSGLKLMLRKELR